MNFTHNHRQVNLESGPITLVNFSKGRYKIKNSPYNVHRDSTSRELVFSVGYGGRKKKRVYMSFTQVREYLEDKLGCSGSDLDEVLGAIP